ncbi:MAG: 16S rRNA processing protein RimM [Muribaculaceae bacterium]|nr:16S rRNA processing protein RimM [Muribaculaceae bacterium]
MITNDEIISIGKFNKTHGINGEISATINAPEALLDNCSCIVSDIDGIFVPFFIKDFRYKSQDMFLLTIDDINNDQEAMMLVNKEIYVKRSEYSEVLEDEDQVPVDFFIGFNAVVNGLQGNIVDIDDSTANVLFVIETTDGKSILIPAVEEFITDFNSKDRIIKMEVPDELLDL